MFTSPFEFTPEQKRLRGDVNELLHSAVIQRELAETRMARSQPHPKNTYRALGRRGWLAINWPTHYGGQGATITEAAIIAEEMALAGVPDSARVNTIENAGATLLSVGTAEQKKTYLPAMAAGDVLCCVLYSEPDAGSDLGSLATHAEPSGSGWRLVGEKLWNVGARAASFGVCAARTGEGASKYADISLFMVPLDAEGVHIEEIPSFNPEALHRLVFDGTWLPADALIGPLGGGWQLISDALVLERTGVNFYGRARRWLDLLAPLGTAVSGFAEQLERLEAELPAARLLTWRCVELLAQGEDASVAGAAAKWRTSVLAAQVVRLAWQIRAHLGSDAGDAFSAPSELACALHEAPGLTIAAGTSEMMLATVSSALIANMAGVEW